MPWFSSHSPWCATPWMHATQTRKISTHRLHNPAVALVVAVGGGSIVDDALSDTRTPTPRTRISALSVVVA